MSYNHGSIVQLTLKNFMQYVEITVKPGKEKEIFPMLMLSIRYERLDVV